MVGRGPLSTLKPNKGAPPFVSHKGKSSGCNATGGMGTTFFTIPAMPARWSKWACVSQSWRIIQPSRLALRAIFSPIPGRIDHNRLPALRVCDDVGVGLHRPQNQCNDLYQDSIPFLDFPICSRPLLNRPSKVRKRPKRQSQTAEQARLTSAHPKQGDDIDFYLLGGQKKASILTTRVRDKTQV